jgi:16S rRNA (guanine527-N7)-methyltransferase
MNKPTVSRGTNAPARKFAGASSAPREVHPVWSAADWASRIPAVLASVGVLASERQCAQLAGYMALLQRWNATYNLTALRSPEDMLSHHLADCLVVVAPLLRHLGLSVEQAQATPSIFKMLDVGSGGGLPGVVLAILCPAVAVTCVDTVGKKAAFIRQVAAELGLPNLKAEHARVESLKGVFHVVTSRAFASLPDFIRWTTHLLAPGGVWMAMKGKQPQDELADLQGLAQVDAVEPLVVPGLDAERCIVWMRAPVSRGSDSNVP